MTIIFCIIAFYFFKFSIDFKVIAICSILWWGTSAICCFSRSILFGLYTFQRTFSPIHLIIFSTIYMLGAVSEAYLIWRLIDFHFLSHIYTTDYVVIAISIKGFVDLFQYYTRFGAINRVVLN